MRCPTLGELPAPLAGKGGWPWTEESKQLPETMPDGEPWPRVSIVTPSYNQGQFIEETIRSVLLQGYPNLEYIIIDGGSSDGSVDIVREYEPWLAYWVSEPDRGQTYAIRKGMDKATGDLVNWLNSDDYLLPGSLGAIASNWDEQEGEYCVLCGHALHVDVSGDATGESHVKSVGQQHKLFPSAPPLVGGIQASRFVTRRAWQLVGGVDVRLKYTMDTDLYHRCHLRGARFVPVGHTVAAYRNHAHTKTVGGWRESIAFKKHFYSLRLLEVPPTERHKYEDRIHRFWCKLYLRSIIREEPVWMRAWKALLGLREYPRFILQPYRMKRVLRLVLRGS